VAGVPEPSRARAGQNFPADGKSGRVKRFEPEDRSGLVPGFPQVGSSEQTMLPFECSLWPESFVVQNSPPIKGLLSTESGERLAICRSGLNKTYQRSTVRLR